MAGKTVACQVSFLPPPEKVITQSVHPLPTFFMVGGG